ncbi:hypothetical protein WEI85_19870 [Actinomycetes bacterium KLBMP 9797]
MHGHPRHVADAALTRAQARHQRLAMDALGDLERYTLRELADLREARAGSRANAIAEYELDAGSALRVAAMADPTRTAWTTIGADPSDAAARLAAAVAPLGDGPALVISARGYGRYGRDAHRLRVDALAAMHAIADRHGVTVGVAGDWLAAEGATGTDIDPVDLPARFAGAYLGHLDSRHAYATHYMNQQRWTEGLRRLGFPERYLDVRQLEHELFTQQVRDIPADLAGSRIAVFRRVEP